MYLTGSDLHWHSDRPPCEYAITLLIDYAPLTDSRYSQWSLDIENREGRVASLYQRIGDALICRGRELRHSRGVVPPGHQSLSLLYHFVDADYQGEMT
ncbi:hypothetical protein C7S18_02280 [Ahniella affigens]|uniref:Fe2OG dioxygenase domain-containing protein n=1 Tax=Ahniella affigens TaxID=2021234 RepID=A0A2P1PML9_9GAMM|nr:hypothetical protein [Ahniella affigens]AVP96091.1 hypothetical protein C7S18_02280 [Ahniella affigens]